MKGRIKISIYAIALLMMGVIGITSALATIGANFPDASQTMIQNLISIPCLIIPTTIIVINHGVCSKEDHRGCGGGVLLVAASCQHSSHRHLLILVMRAILGVGVGISQL
ncbi:MAG: hypothetical protein ACLVJO_02665 [[Clostridium] scindens]